VLHQCCLLRLECGNIGGDLYVGIRVIRALGREREGERDKQREWCSPLAYLRRVARLSEEKMVIADLFLNHVDVPVTQVDAHLGRSVLQGCTIRPYLDF
jgi:hypothetical protein